MVRVGIGYDVHRFEEGRELILGGVRIPSERGLAGHSDADVLVHAIADALLGAAALGDIGTHFPDTDEAWKDADSLFLLAEVTRKLIDHGMVIQNVDASVALQSPKIGSYRKEMEGNISSALNLPSDRVSVKATTTEGLGFVGTLQGAAAYAICSIDDGS